MPRLPFPPFYPASRGSSSLSRTIEGAAARRVPPFTILSLPGSSFLPLCGPTRNRRTAKYISLLANQEQGMAQWWEHTPPTSVAPVQIPATTPFVNSYCGLSFLLVRYLASRSLFLGITVFPSSQKPALSNSTRNGKQRTSTWICYL